MEINSAMDVKNLIDRLTRQLKRIDQTLEVTGNSIYERNDGFKTIVFDVNQQPFNFWQFTCTKVFEKWNVKLSERYMRNHGLLEYKEIAEAITKVLNEDDKKLKKDDKISLNDSSKEIIDSIAKAGEAMTNSLKASIEDVNRWSKKMQPKLEKINFPHEGDVLVLKDKEGLGYIKKRLIIKDSWNNDGYALLDQENALITTGMFSNVQALLADIEDDDCYEVYLEVKNKE